MLDQSTRWFLSGEGIGPGENQAKIIQTKKPLRHYHHHHHHPQIHSAVLFVIVLLLSVLCSSTKASDISSNDIFDDDVELFDADESQNFHQSLEFTQEVYDVVIPENSLGKVYAVPSDLNTKMGISLEVCPCFLHKQFIFQIYRLFFEEINIFCHQFWVN